MIKARTILFTKRRHKRRNYKASSS